jgi:hypothetical protein
MYRYIDIILTHTRTRTHTHTRTHPSGRRALRVSTPSQPRCPRERSYEVDPARLESEKSGHDPQHGIMQLQAPRANRADACGRTLMPRARSCRAACASVRAPPRKRRAGGRADGKPRHAEACEAPAAAGPVPWGAARGRAVPRRAASYYARKHVCALVPRVFCGHCAADDLAEVPRSDQGHAPGHGIPCHICAGTGLARWIVDTLRSTDDTRLPPGLASAVRRRSSSAWTPNPKPPTLNPKPSTSCTFKP